MSKIPYPNTPKKPYEEEFHGEKISDPYHWLEDFETDKVQGWIRKQNNLTNKLIPKHLLNQLTDEIMPLVDREYENIRVRKGEYHFYLKKLTGQNQKMLMVRNLKTEQEKVLINPNTWSEEGTIALDWTFASPKGTYVAYGCSSGGSERSMLYVIETKTGEVLTETIPNAKWCSLAWKNDETGFYYTRYPDKGDVPEGEEEYHRKLFYHQLSDNYKQDKLIIGDLRKKEEMINIKAASDKKHFLVSRTVDWVMNDLYLLDGNSDELKPLVVGLDGAFSGDMISNKVIVFTNYEAPRGKIIEINPNEPEQENWKTLIEETNDIIDQYNFQLMGDSIFVSKLHNAYNKAYFYNLKGELKKEIQLPALGSVYDVEGIWNQDEFYLNFASFFYPQTIYKGNISTGNLELVFKPSTGDFNKEHYEVKQIWYKSKDSTKIPMFIVKEKEIKLDGKSPTWLTGYGGFGVNLTPYYSHLYPILLKRGFIIAIPNLRGGGEFGKEWHLAGRKENKQNVFDDFIAAAEWLIENQYTDTEHLVISGGSNGGLLVGAALTQRPELFKAVICQVPLLDMLRWHNFYVASIWADEYGSPENPEDYKYLKKYSPYHNVNEDINYPAVLFTTAESDTRVHPMHALKMTALLQNLENEDPILLKYERKAGHGAGKPTKKIAEDYAYLIAFVLWQLG